jgi:hypothetical protein
MMTKKAWQKADSPSDRKENERLRDQSMLRSWPALLLWMPFLINCCTPAARYAPSAPVSPLSVVGDSDDHRGFVLRGSLARIYLANGLQVIAPPEKDLIGLYGDLNTCRYGCNASTLDLYVTCLHDRGDTLISPHGIVLPGAPQFTGILPPSIPAPGENTLESTPDHSGRPIPEQTKQAVDKVVLKCIVDWGTHSREGGRAVASMCMHEAIAEGFKLVLRAQVCGNMKILDRLETISHLLREGVEAELECV